MTENKTGKKWYRSKTIWTSFIGLVSGIVGAVHTGGDPWTISLATISGLELVLRGFTSEGIIR